jgi:hypothetical protein
MSIAESPPIGVPVRRRPEPVAFRLHGVACHVCGRPATAWTAGVTLPCGCGRRTVADRPGEDPACRRA